MIRFFSKLWSIEILRFLAIGGINTFFSTAMYFVFLFLNIHFALANFMALICGIVFSFCTSKKIIFKVKGNLSYYIFLWISLYIINISAISMLVALGFQASIAGLISTPFIAICSYVAQKKIVFNKL